MNIKLLSKSKSYNGEVRRYNHTSESLSCDMKFHVYVPPKSNNITTGVLWFLSGLTCTDENFIQKSGAIQFASENNVFLVCPDTSPRGIKLENEQETCWSGPGFGAGYYLDAKTDGYKEHFKMFTYITKELYELINLEFKELVNVKSHSIFGHSMGGLGAINLYLKTINNNQFKSVSAFSPISNPVNCEWSRKALIAYLGDDESLLLQYDPSNLLKSYNGVNKINILIDQGSDDEFLQDLKFDQLKLACQGNDKINLTARLQDGYNHGYFYISTFIKDHIEFHSKYLKN